MASQQDWRGRLGREWARRAADTDALLAPIGAAGYDALDEIGGARLLDLGCGAGAATLDLAALTGARGAVVGADVSAALIALAGERRRAARRANVGFVLRDASMGGFGARFDAIYSRCGTMFFDEPVAAFARLRGLVSPGGRVVALAWRPLEENPWAAIPLAAGAPFLPPPDPPPRRPPPGPFAWADPERSALPVLKAAGWRRPRARRIDRKVALGAGPGANEATEFAMRIGPLASRLRAVEDETRARVADAVAAALRPYAVDGAVRLRAAAWLVTAQA